MYKAIKYFTDALDGEHPYREGDPYPREGLKVSGARLRELSTKANRRGEVLIVKVETPKQTRKAKEE